MPSMICQRRALALAGALALCSAAANAFTVNISALNPQGLYLQVGVGAFSGLYSAGNSTPGVNPRVNVVSVTVPAAQVGSGTAQTMTTDSTASRSYYDNFVFCNAPAQLYVGGFYRRTGGGGTAATLTATAPANLVSAAGATIPFSQIQWTSSGNSDTGAQPFPAGTFAGGQQTIGSIQRNQWAESCHTFLYRNQAVVPAGTYTGRVTYTLTAP